MPSKRGTLRNDDEFRFLKEQLDDQNKADTLEQADIERIDWPPMNAGSDVIYRLNDQLL